MKEKIKTIFAVLLLTFDSLMTYLAFAYAYLAVGGAVYSAQNNHFDGYSMVSLFTGLQIVINFVFTYLVSLIYLCRKMQKIKKWMTVIPIVISILLAVLGVAILLLTNFQFE